MNNKLFAFLMLALLATLDSQLATLHAQGTAFTYNGRLIDNGSPANGSYDLKFTLFNVSAGPGAVAGPLTNAATGVTNGLFTVALDFGANFSGADRFLEIAARTNGGGAFATLSPRQKITATPYAITAGDVTGANIARLTVPNTAQPATGFPTVNNGFIIAATVTFGGSGYTTAPAVTVNDSTGSGAMITATVSGGQVTGLTVNTAGSGYSAGASVTIGAPPSNATQTFASSNNFSGVNLLTNPNNAIAGNGAGLTGLNASQLTSGTVADARLSGNVGLLNANQTFSGINTFTNARGNFSGNGAGLTSLNAGNLVFGTLADGRLSGNVAFLNSSPTFAGDIAMAGGADYHRLSLSGGNSLGFLYGSYLRWADGIHPSYNYYADAGGNDHTINAGGGTSRITVGYGNVVVAVGLAGAPFSPVVERLRADFSGVTVYGTFNNSSDRNAKQGFAPVSPSQILDKVLQLPLSEWSYKEDSATRHIGPMGQDFYSVFNIGTDDKHIAPIDESGVALAAIQGLNEKLNEKDAEIQALKQSVADLKKMVQTLAERQ